MRMKAVSGQLDRVEGFLFIETRHGEFEVVGFEVSDVQVL